MNKLQLLAAAVIGLLCAQNVRAQSENMKILAIDEMFRLANQNNKQLKLLKTGIEISKKSIEVVKNKELPNIGASLSFSYLGNGFITDRDFSNFAEAPMPHLGNNFAIEASQVIFAGGAISNSIEKANLEEQIAQLSFEKAGMDIRLLLIGNYLELFKLQNQKKVYLDHINQINLLIKQIKSKRQEGMALTNDVTRHELVLKNIELAITEIDNNCKIINYHLVTTLGLPSNMQIMPDTTIINAKVSDGELADYIQIGKNNLPELKSTLINMKIAGKGVELAKADYLPSIGIFAGNHFDGPITIEVPPIDKNLNYWYVGVGLKYSLSSLFTTKKVVDLAETQVNMASDERNVIEEQTNLGIQSALIKYKESFEQLQTLEKSLQLAKENYSVINYRYVNNLALITEILDANNSKLNAELQVMNAKINIVFNYYKLQRTIGKI